ncbi:zinc-dependent alcohol dehydrogenase family protein [Steroidobacter sp.]|uniref:zinc-dependent alcohol dehydrogenase family protein n=1 Tax=Steroidobacter sp. TaxID=1978227 RepID=UPI001A54D2AC|nr:NAD(P)-dependent alcohol dehydrogenase [Steroidobacter sp.]MBL8271540.1 NAD(P)-dependent alcohol dehydrogenase [Steroidobacter sp.]
MSSLKCNRLGLAAMSLYALVPLLAQASALPATARKVVVEKAGERYEWKLVQAPLPQIADDQVLVRVLAISLNRSELSRLNSQSFDTAATTPVSDAAGEVVAVGRSVKNVRKGARVTNTFFRNWIEGPYREQYLDAVYGWSIDGVAAEYIALDARAVVPITNGFSYEEASTLPTAAVTAWNGVMGRVITRKGDVVLIQGTGGVATFALQFAVAAGAHPIVTSSSDEKLAHAAKLGARDGINYRTEPEWPKAVLRLTQGRGADLVIDVVGKSTLQQSVASLADAGTLAIIGGITGYDGSLSSWGLLKKSATARGIFVGSRADYLRMNEFMGRHRLRPLVDRVYPIEQYAEALQAMESGEFMGKIVLTF